MHDKCLQYFPIFIDSWLQFLHRLQAGLAALISPNTPVSACTEATPAC